MLIVLGILLFAPVPLTNYPFGLLLLGYAFALIERDGKLMLLCWVLGLFEVSAGAFMSSQLVTWGAELATWARGLF